MKNFFSTRKAGFWVSIVVAVLMAALMVIYNRFFFWSQYYDRNTMITLGAGLGAGVVLAVVGIFSRPLGEWTSAALGAGSFLGLLYFLKGSWLMIQDAFGGYENRGFIDGFWPFVVLVAVCIVLSIINVIFLSQAERKKA